MKIFYTEGVNVNFVDENNVFLGYSLTQDCCEHADWFISDAIEKRIIERKDNNPNLDGWVFDKVFYCSTLADREDLDEGKMAVFRIVSGDEEKYIHLYNIHNGYYAHGFEFKIGDEITRAEYL